MGANRPLVRDTLLGDFGFKGFVLSDFLASGDTVGSALAGQSLALPGANYYEPSLLRAALAEGRLKEATVDDLVRRYLRTLFRFGVFDRGARSRTGPLPRKRDAHIARTVAGRGVVLLRNRRSLLPLRPGRLGSVAVIGRSANEYQRPNSLSSGGVQPLLTVTLRDAIDRTGRGGRPFRVRYSDGADLAQAARLARRSRVAVVAVAPSAASGEFADRVCLALDCPPAAAHQDALVRAVAKANPRTVVVVQSPGPVLMPWARDIPAILEGWWPGETGGEGIADVLFGRVNPSARLPVTFPRAETDLPTRTRLQFPGVSGRGVYSEGVLVGYRWYDQRRIRPLFPFGFGLSYTSFHYGDLEVRDLKNAHSAGKVRVKLRVANVGSRRGAEVVQLYVGLPRAAAGVVQPPKALKRFRRVEIPSGRSRDVTFSLEDRDFSYWDVRRHAWRVAAGCYRILLGSSSRDIRLEDVIARGSAGCARPAGSAGQR
jgi:beta-glucosidase